MDLEVKPEFYAGLGVREYWRFDETGEYHGARLGGDILVEDRYEPVPIETTSDNSLQGYSPVLNLYLRWEGGALVFYDPDTSAPIASLEDEQQARATAEACAEAAEVRVQELEEQLRRQGV